MNYIQQQYDWDCIPTAASNALRWAGLKSPNRRQLITALQTDEDGTSYHEIIQFLKQYFRVSFSRSPQLSVLRAQQNPNLALLVTFTDDYDHEPHGAFYDGQRFPNCWLKPNTIQRALTRMDQDDFILELRK